MVKGIFIVKDISDSNSYVTDFIFGSTILATTLLISCSRTFKFCVFHRVIIMCNLVIQMLYIINNNTEAILLIFQMIIYNILLVHYIINKAKQNK